MHLDASRDVLLPSTIFVLFVVCALGASASFYFLHTSSVCVCGRGLRCNTLSFLYLFPVQQTTSGTGHRVKQCFGVGNRYAECEKQQTTATSTTATSTTTLKNVLQRIECRLSKQAQEGCCGRGRCSVWASTGYPRGSCGERWRMWDNAGWLERIDN